MSAQDVLLLLVGFILGSALTILGTAALTWLMIRVAERANAARAGRAGPHGPRGGLETPEARERARSNAN